MAEVKEHPVVWFQGAGCSGCSVSFLNGVAPDPVAVLIEQLLPGHHINLRFHPTIMAGSGEAVIKAIRATQEKFDSNYILVVEGAIPKGRFGMIGEEDGRELEMEEAVVDFAKRSLCVVAYGTCAAFGGIPSGKPNPTGARGVAQVLKEHGVDKVVVNIPGCPAHPDWLSGTIAALLLLGLDKVELDDLNRPKRFFGKLIHDNCPRRAYFDTGRFAKNFGDELCLLELGCKGPQTYADCPIRLWNGGVNWCVGSNAPCIGCVEPEFPDNAPLYEKMTEDRYTEYAVRTREED